jgi:hypothetical protein
MVEPEPEPEPEPELEPEPDEDRGDGGGTAEAKEVEAAAQLSGFMEKKGEHFGASFKRRFFALDGDKLVYSETPGSPPKGCIAMAAEPAVRFSEHPDATSGELEVVTPARTYRLRCATAADARRWIVGLTGAKGRAASELPTPAPAGRSGASPRAVQRDRADAGAVAEARFNAMARLKLLETKLIGSIDPEDDAPTEPIQLDEVRWPSESARQQLSASGGASGGAERNESVAGRPPDRTRSSTPPLRAFKP